MNSSYISTPPPLIPLKTHKNVPKLIKSYQKSYETNKNRYKIRKINMKIVLGPRPGVQKFSLVFFIFTGLAFIGLRLKFFTSPSKNLWVSELENFHKPMNFSKKNHRSRFFFQNSKGQMGPADTPLNRRVKKSINLMSNAF